ncbi:putative membrane protein [Bacillus subtilis]|uniref:YidH family protein n=1 Tax=Bacillus inaquosorum TaxID=483913 RepID=UPI001060D454|nr:putative membrane protein [Bacillus subtilis]
MKALIKRKDQPEDSVKYAQQHLANERTYLAWIRTAISIAGVGFLTTSLHFTIKINSDSVTNTLAIFLGIFACVVGLVTGVLATIQYSKKKREIQNGFFIPSNHSIIFVSSLFSLLLFLIFMYLSLLLFKS